MNILNIKNCYGCGVCATVCAKKIIKIRHNKDGFYEPYITDITQCTNCGLCKAVCAYSYNEIANTPINIKAYAAWSNSSAIRHKCSSGGVCFEICKHLLEKGYKVCSVQYSPEQNIAKHYISTNIEELIPSIGSKYIQSYTVEGFKAINKKEKYIIIGTPCQIDSLRRYIKKFKVEDNFILIDFFCHGVPSYLIWQAYSKEVIKQTGPFTDVVWRHKLTGWHDSWAISINGKKKTGNITESNIVYGLKIEETKGAYFSRMSKGDKFYNLFLGNNCLGKACYNKCKYKYTSSSADIRLGDLWGKKYNDNNEGVSSVVTFTSKGQTIIEDVTEINKIEHSIPIVAEGQMQHKIKYPIVARYTILTMAKLGFSIQVLSFTSKVFNKLKRIFKLQ